MWATSTGELIQFQHWSPAICFISILVAPPNESDKIDEVPDIFFSFLATTRSTYLFASLIVGAGTGDGCIGPLADAMSARYISSRNRKANCKVNKRDGYLYMVTQKRGGRFFQKFSKVWSHFPYQTITLSGSEGGNFEQACLYHLHPLKLYRV
jgi:hypothetical protein